MRILVCGDAMVDRYWFGEVERISPEAPVPVVRMMRQEERPGAAANVARNCEAMGAQVDRLFSPSRERVVKIRLIAKQQQVARIDFDEPQEPVSEALFKALLPKADVVVLSDYGKGALTEAESLIALAKGEGKTVLVDPKGVDYSRYRYADVVKPNLHEMRDLVGGWTSEESLEQKIADVRSDYNIWSVLLTRASAGMTLYAKGHVKHIASQAREVFDVSGAGDTAIAALAVGMAKGLSLERAAHFANRAAGIAVGRFGTAVVTADEIRFHDAEEAIA